MKRSEKSVFQLRIQERIQHALLDLFNKSEMTLRNKIFFISITSVDISPDLKNLKIFTDIVNMEKADKINVIKALNKDNIPVIKKLLANKINLKYVPEVQFFIDDSNEKLYKISKIIEKEKEKY